MTYGVNSNAYPIPGDPWSSEDYGTMNPNQDGPGRDSYHSSGYTDRTVTPCNFPRASKIREDLEGLYAEIYEDSSLSYDQKNNLLLQIKDLQERLSGLGDDTPPSKEILDQYHLLETHLVAKATVSTEDPHGNDKLLNEIEDLNKKIEEKLNDPKLSPNEKEKLNGLITKLGAEKSALDLDSGDKNVRHAQGVLENVREKFKTWIEGIQSKIDDVCQEIHQFASDQENFAGLGKDGKTYKTRLQNLGEKLKNGQVSVEEAKSQLKEIQKSIQKIGAQKAKTEELKGKYTGLATLVPNEGYGVDRARSLTEDISQAMKNGGWDAVRANLDDLKKNHEQEMDNAMRQFAGTIFYGVCGGDLQATKEMLSVIPKDILTKMSGLLLGCGEVDANDYSEESSKKLKSFYYGTGRQTAELFRSASELSSES